MSAVYINNGVVQINNERNRQVNSEGYTYEHDDNHKEGELAGAALSYVLFYGLTNYLDVSPDEALDEALAFWPWDSEDEKSFMKPEQDPIKNLVKAGALIAAEIDRLNRLQNSSTETETEKAQVLTQ